jgi:glycolate oxidase FAD binding subunit
MARSPLRISGRSTWLDAGRPVRANDTLSLRDDEGVVSYVPGDLTLTVRAGTPLSEIERVTQEHDQWLPLDPYGLPDGTIGATIATASAGPLASGFGLPRDLLLGLEFVNGRGEVVRGGGKVVKNVAGFDLSRLLTGSWGTLGVITEVTLRLYALPKADRTFAVALRGSEKEVSSLVRAIVASPLTPFALQLLNPPAARALGLGEKPVCLIRFGGNEALVRAQLGALSQVARPEEIESAIWTRLRQLDGKAHTTIRVSSMPQRFLAASAKILSDDASRDLHLHRPASWHSEDHRRG